MAPPSPRRSSRARATNSQSQQSSNSSSASSRTERNTRSLNKPPSSKSTPSASLSSEPPDDLDDVRTSRRRNRGQEDSRDKSAQLESVEMTLDGDEIQEDDEAVRCLCGFDDYPGPPPADEDTKHSRGDADADVYSVPELTDDVSGFFVQCDICKVWQHGACVGIMTEESSPEEYFCEKCRKDLHKIHVASNGQRYSTYLPIHRPSRNTSRATSLVKEGSSKNRKVSPNTSARNAASKRRSTLNSREAGYNEDEILRRVLEASKEDALPEQVETRSQRPKRGRSDSEENQSTVKRQRTSSRSLSPNRDRESPVKDDDSDDDVHTRNGSSKKAKPPRTQKEKLEREEREKQRQEAANKRKVRADRRRAEGITATVLLKDSEAHEDADSDPSEEVPLSVTRVALPAKVTDAVPVVDPPASSLLPPDTPPASAVPASSAHKKSASRNHKKSKGRNQYTKDDNEVSPARSMSRDIQKNDEAAASATSRPTPLESTKHGHKGKNGHNSKLSMTDMKRRVTAFLDFISRTQLELAAETMPSSKTSAQSSPQDTTGEVPKIQVNGGGSAHSGGESAAGFSPTDGRDFKEMNCVEMMDVLTRDMLKWQNQYAA